jgi:hypothetical protein
MRRVISSGWTIVFKLVVPLVLMSLSIFLVVGLFAYSPRPPTDALIGTLLTVAATAFFCWWGTRLKRVSVDDQNLYASNLIKETSIPLLEIDALDAGHGGWPVRVRLKAKSELGRTIFFLATWQPFLFSKTHPILEELRQLMNQKAK